MIDFKDLQVLDHQKISETIPFLLLIYYLFYVLVFLIWITNIYLYLDIYLLNLFIHSFQAKLRQIYLTIGSASYHCTENEVFH